MRLAIASPAPDDIVEQIAALSPEDLRALAMLLALRLGIKEGR